MRTAQESATKIICRSIDKLTKEIHYLRRDIRMIHRNDFTNIELEEMDKEEDA